MSRQVRVGAWWVVLATVVASCGGQGDVLDVSAARPAGVDQELEVSVDACVDLGSAVVSAEEDDTSVKVEVRGVVEGPGCVTTFMVALRSPLGDRAVIDGFDGEEVPVHRR